MAETVGPQTNITRQQSETFNAMVSGKFDNFALFSCFLDGKPATAIVTVNKDDDGQFIIVPLYVAVTPDMVLTDHDGTPTGGVA